MMSTTLHSTTTKGRTVEVFPLLDGDVLLDIRDPGGEQGAIYVRETGLLDALGAVPKARAEDAEAFGAAAVARAEEAEATIERVREVLDPDNAFRTAYEVQAAVSRALIQQPAFILPTEAGVRFEARRVGTTYGFQSVAFTDAEDGPIILHLREEDRIAFTATEVMRYFTDHRLPGADQ